MSTRESTDRARAVKVVGALLAMHLLAHGVHGIPHATIPVFLPPTVTAGVLLFVFVLPVSGFLLLWQGADRLGVAVFTVSMVVSLVLAGTLHFVVPNPDHVASIPAGLWKDTFRGTAGLLAIVDALGTVVGVRLWRDRRGDRVADRPQTGRVAGVPDAGFRPLTRLTYWVTRRWFGEVPESLTVTAHHPKLLGGLNAYETALIGADRVDERLKELAVLKTAMVVGCEFCIDIGTAQATELGITEPELRGLREFETSHAFAEHERLALRYAVAMSTTPADVPDELFDALAAEFDKAALVELTATIAFENYRARFNQAFGIDPQGFAEGAYCPRPEVEPEASAEPGERATSRPEPGDRR